MPRKSTGPWYWTARAAWYCVVDGKRYLLVRGDENATAVQAREEYRRRFGVGADAVAARITTAFGKLQGKYVAGRVLAVLAGMDQAAGRLVADVLERAVVSPPLDHLDRSAVIDRVDWRRLHRDVWNGTLREGAVDLVDVDKYREFNTEDALDDCSDDEAALTMRGGEIYANTAEGDEQSRMILEDMGFPTDAEALAQLATVYPAIKRDR
jgi:hypothetical protein